MTMGWMTWGLFAKSNYVIIAKSHLTDISCIMFPEIFEITKENATINCILVLQPIDLSLKRSMQYSMNVRRFN